MTSRNLKCHRCNGVFDTYTERDLHEVMCRNAHGLPDQDEPEDSIEAAIEVGAVIVTHTYVVTFLRGGVAGDLSFIIEAEDSTAAKEKASELFQSQCGYWPRCPAIVMEHK